MFLLIVIVVMLSYGVSFQTMMYPQRSFYSGIFFDLLYYPYWEMHGDIELGSTIEGFILSCNFLIHLHLQLTIVQVIFR